MKKLWIALAICWGSAIGLSILQAEPVRGPTRGTVSGGGSPSGPAGGVLLGTYPDPSFSLPVSSPGAGVSSESFGSGSTVPGLNGTAVGESASASTDAVALGKSTSAAGVRSTALGRGASCAFTDDTCVGFGSIASAATATAIGGNSRAGGTGSTSVGQASEANPFAAQGTDGVALGAGASVRATGGIAIGSGANTGLFEDSIAIGRAAATTADNQGRWGSAANPVSLELFSRLVEDQDTFGVDDTTPDISRSTHFLTNAANTVTTTITDLDFGEPGQVISICGPDDTFPSQINDGGNFDLPNGDIVFTSRVCLLLLVEADNDYRELSRAPAAIVPLTVSQATATASDTILTAEGTVLVVGMSLTPGAGNYFVNFSSSLLLDTAASQSECSIFVGGVQEAASIRIAAIGGNQTIGVILPLGIAGYRVAGVGASESIEIRCDVDAGEVEIFERNLSLLRE